MVFGGRCRSRACLKVLIQSPANIQPPLQIPVRVSNASRVRTKRLHIYAKKETRGRKVIVDLVTFPHSCRRRHHQIFYRKLVGWKHLTHPNVVPVLGITFEPLQLILAGTPCQSIFTITHSRTGSPSLVSRSTCLANPHSSIAKVKILSSFRLYLAMSTLVIAECAEVIRWDADLGAARACTSFSFHPFGGCRVILLEGFPVCTSGDPTSGLPHTAPRRKAPPERSGLKDSD